MKLVNISIQKFKHKFLSGHRRDVVARKNILASFFIKGANILVGLLLVPMVLHYLGQAEYGIWLTLGSIVGWFSFFDIGLGHGLRNKFAEAVATNKMEKARTYISTAYAIMSVICLGLLLIFFITNRFLNWASILNASSVSNNELQLVALLIFGFFCLQFIFKLITSVLLADQKTAARDLMDFLTKVLNVILLFFITQNTDSSLALVAVSYGVAPLVLMLVFSLVLFNGRYKPYRPGLSHVKFSGARGLFNLGFKFFIIQISVIVLYTTDNVIISHLFEPENVVPYQISLKYFGMLSMAFTIITAPFWSATTEAFAKGEMDWIRKSKNKLIQFWGLSIIVIILMGLLANWIYGLWIGGDFSVHWQLTAGVGFYMVVFIFSTIYTTFLNGMGKIKMSIYSSVFDILTNIPLSIWFAKGLGLGLAGVILATAVANVITGILRWIQFNKLINGTATGIWNK